MSEMEIWIEDRKKRKDWVIVKGEQEEMQRRVVCVCVCVWEREREREREKDENEAIKWTSFLQSLWRAIFLKSESPVKKSTEKKTPLKKPTKKSHEKKS